MGRIYFRSSVESNTQDVARTVLGEIARTVATTAAKVEVVRDPSATNPDGWEAYCIAGVMYSFRTGIQLVRSSMTSPQKSDRVFVKSVVLDPLGNPTGNCNTVAGITPQKPQPPSGATTASIELLNYNMRIEHFSINTYGRLHVMKLDLVYGGDPDDEELEKAIFEFENETTPPPPPNNYLDFQLSDPDPNKWAHCNPREAFCAVLKSEREVYQSVAK